MATNKNLVTAQDLYKLEHASGATLSSEGNFLAYSQRWVDKSTEKKFSNLWVTPTSRSAPKRFTHGNHFDHSPTFSPDGKQLAFFSNRRSESQFQIYLIPIDGGEACPLTNVKGDFGSLEWSPDGKQLLCMFRKKDQDDLDREKDEQKKKLGVVSRHITRTFFKMDGEGFYPKERWHLWLFNTKTGKGEQLTDGLTHEEYSPAWSPDGTKVIYVSNHADEPDLDPEAEDLYILNLKSGRSKRMNLPIGGKAFPSFSPDGKQVAWIGSEGRGDWWQNNKIFVTNANGKEKVRNLTGLFDIDANTFTINDLNDSHHTRPVWSTDGTKIYFQVAQKGKNILCSVAVSTKKPEIETLIDERGVVEDFLFNGTQDRLVYLFPNENDTGQYHVRDMQSGSERVLTKVNSNWFKKKTFGDLEEVWFKGSDKNDIQGWILKPPGFKKGKKYPSIMEIHGGPMTQYGHLFMHEFQYLAATGYVVYFCNPRGGMGYGEEHAKVIENAWGTKDYEDLMCWADYLSKQPYIDKKRMGVTGGSYGGYMTCWMVTHTHRFKAAATQRCVSNLVSMYGSSDFNWMFQREFGDKPAWDITDSYWEQSPMKHVGNTKTPTLVIHSEQDLRCDIEQSEQFYVALKKLGVPTEFIRFPDESHGLSRVGRTDRRIVRLEHLKRWFDRYL